MQIIMENGAVVGVFSFTTGFVRRKCTPHRMTETDVLAMALWLERHNRPEEGEVLIEQWCAGVTLYIH